jgi:hypothetical protein
MFKDLIFSGISIIAAVSSLFFFRRVRAECRENYIKPPGIFNFWIVIDGIWEKSKKPGKEKLKAEIIKMVISWLIFLGCIPFLVN